MSLHPEAISYHTNPNGASDYFFGAGSSPSPSAGVILNNANIVSIPSAVYTLNPNNPQIIATVVVPANYGTSPLTVIPYAQLLAAAFTLKSTTPPILNDTVKFILSVSDGINTETLYPQITADASTLADFVTIPLFAGGFMGTYAQGPYTFTFRISALYTSTGSSPFNLTVNQFITGVNVVAGVKTF